MLILRSGITRSSESRSKIPILVFWSWSVPNRAVRALVDYSPYSGSTLLVRQVLSAHIVLIPHPTHYVFQSNEADVLRDICDFITKLRPAKWRSSTDCSPVHCSARSVRRSRRGTLYLRSYMATRNRLLRCNSKSSAVPGVLPPTPTWPESRLVPNRTRTGTFG
jgi:hypothetical protein